MHRSIEIGIDTGGTFTDVVARRADGRMDLLKIPSTRGNESVGVRHAIAQILEHVGCEPADIVRIVHGTTISTNAMIEKTTARTGVITTEGFRDILEIGRQNRADMYDLALKPSAPTFLVPRRLRKEVRERVGPDGKVIVPLDEATVEVAVRSLLEDRVEAIAICFLFSFLNPDHERRTRDLVAELAPGVAISISSDVDPTFREFERFCVTTFDACIKPILSSYIGRIVDDLATAGIDAPFQIMQSRGAVMSASTALEQPVRLFLSGPAAGVVGALSAGLDAGFHNLITMDVGGTSSDISLVRDGRPALRQEGYLDGYTIRVPMVDVNAIGAGGGSIGWIDAAGGLRLGPRSAGAEPGPACYGRGGTEATITDASIVLGYIDPDYFAGGRLKLDADLARQAVATRIAEPLGVSVEAAALGIHRVANSHMADGIRVVSVKRGIDPRGLALVSLGGAGGVHAAAVADELGLTTIVVPPAPGVLSAAGLLTAPLEYEAMLAYGRQLKAADPAEMKERIAVLDRSCADRFGAETANLAIQRLHYADVCYVGQSHYLTVPIRLPLDVASLESLYETFVAYYHELYGHSTRGSATIVNLRAVHRLAQAAPDATTPSAANGAAVRSRPVLMPGADAPVEAAIHDRRAILPGDTIYGPAIVEQEDSTTVIPVGWTARANDAGTLIVTREATQ